MICDGRGKELGLHCSFSNLSNLMCWREGSDQGQAEWFLPCLISCSSVLQSMSVAESFSVERLPWGTFFGSLDVLLLQVLVCFRLLTCMEGYGASTRSSQRLMYPRRVLPLALQLLSDCRLALAYEARAAWVVVACRFALVALRHKV